MKLHYQLRRDNDTYLSEVIKQYNDIVPEVLCKELIEFFEKSITFRIDDHRKQSRELAGGWGALHACWRSLGHL